MRVGLPVDFIEAGDEAQEIYPAAEAFSSEKSRLVAGLLALFLGGLGIHKFYLGYKAQGLIMLLCTLFGFFLLFVPTAVIGVIAFIEAIIYLVKSENAFQKTYVVGKRGWF